MKLSKISDKIRLFGYYNFRLFILIGGILASIVTYKILYIVSNKVAENINISIWVFTVSLLIFCITMIKVIKDLIGLIIGVKKEGSVMDKSSQKKKEED